MTNVSGGTVGTGVSSGRDELVDINKRLPTLVAPTPVRSIVAHDRRMRHCA
jgi:hypothetical protein